jgi:S1-C subfamily serine protease
MAAGRGSAKITIGQPPFLGIQIASTAANGPSPATDPQQQLQQIEQAAQQHGGGVNSSQRCLPSRAQSPVPAAAAPVGSGALIAGAFCNSPAHSAGMLGGDVITAVNGRAVSSAAGLTRLMLAHYHPGDIVSVSWVGANGQHHTSSLTLAAGPAR